MYCVDYMQKSKASKVEGGQSSSSTQKTALLQQLGLVPSVAVDNNSSVSSEASSSEEKTDNQTEGEKQEEADDPFLPADRPQQKNKKKCWICKLKLELAQRELGSCKCGKLSLML